MRKKLYYSIKRNGEFVICEANRNERTGLYRRATLFGTTESAKNMAQKLFEDNNFEIVENIW